MPSNITIDLSDNIFNLCHIRGKNSAIVNGVLVANLVAETNKMFRAVERCMDISGPNSAYANMNIQSNPSLDVAECRAEYLWAILLRIHVLADRLSSLFVKASSMPQLDLGIYWAVAL